MFFKNVLFYQFQEPFHYEPEGLHAALAENQLLPCPKTEAFSRGWTSPFGYGKETLLHTSMKNIWLNLGKEEKLLPSAVINDELAKELKIIENREDRVLYRKERLRLKEEITLKLRTQAFTKKIFTHAYIDTTNQWLVINSSNRNKAEDLCAYLRSSLGSLKLQFPQTQHNPAQIMSEWLMHKKLPAHFNIEDSCDLIDTKHISAEIKIRKQDLLSQEITAHLHSGKQVTRLCLNWQDKISFELSEDLSLRKIKFLNVNAEKSYEKDLDQHEKLDADFTLMSQEFSLLLNELLAEFNQ